MPDSSNDTAADSTAGARNALRNSPRPLHAPLREAMARHPEIPASLLSFIAAFVDTAVFIGLFGIFTAHITGNLVLIGARLVNDKGELLPKLLALPEFAIAVALAVLLSRRLHRRHRSALPQLLGVEALLLLATVAATMLLPKPGSGGDLSTLVIGVFASGAMGFQNAMMRLELSFMPPSTAMTSTVTQTVIDSVVALVEPKGSSLHKTTVGRLRRTMPSIVGFFLGAAGGAWGYYAGGFLSLLLPAAMCLMLVVLYRVAPPATR